MNEFIAPDVNDDDSLPDLLDLNESLSVYINERNQFENNLYDYLLTGNQDNIVFIFPENEPDESFWEPVVVSYKNVNLLPDIIGENTCTICTDLHLNFKKMKCCGQSMCNGCCYEWFERSVKCPYCIQDIRDFD